MLNAAWTTFSTVFISTDLTVFAYRLPPLWNPIKKGVFLITLRSIPTCYHVLSIRIPSFLAQLEWIYESLMWQIPRRWVQICTHYLGIYRRRRRVYQLKQWMLLPYVSHVTVTRQKTSLNVVSSKSNLALIKLISSTWIFQHVTIWQYEV